jgi:uncharacterized membrane protein YeaQ/YmgE (transglycosylase-associated protein family)
LFISVIGSIRRHVKVAGLQFRRYRMSFLAWIVLGLLAGFTASKIVNKQGEGFVVDLVLGIVGAVVGGWLFGLFGLSGATGLNFYSLLVAVAGAIVVLLAYHLLRRATSSHRSAA